MNKPDPNQQPPSPAPDAEMELNSQARRRVEEFHRQVLSRRDPLEAALGSLNAELMQMGHVIGQAINGHLAGGAANLGQVLQAGSAIELHCKITRQIERFSQLALSLHNKGSKANTQNRFKVKRRPPR